MNMHICLLSKSQKQSLKVNITETN